MKRSLGLLLGIAVLIVPDLVFAASSKAIDKLSKRSAEAGLILQENRTVPEAFAKSILKNAECVASIPGTQHYAFILGANYGRGLVSCRTAQGWSQPVFLIVGGGTFGFQAGGSLTDSILVFKNRSSLRTLARSHLTLGTDASIAVGPVGRDLHGGTNFTFQTEIVSYSRVQGLYAGVNLNGVKLQVDHAANAAIYGSGYRVGDLLTTPADPNLSTVTGPFLQALP